MEEVIESVPPSDPGAAFLDDEMSQSNISNRPPTIPTIQWIASRNNGGCGWFTEKKFIEEAGHRFSEPPDGWEKVQRNLGGRDVEGWFASALHFHFLLVNLAWEVSWSKGRSWGKKLFPRFAKKDADALAEAQSDPNDKVRPHGRFQAIALCLEFGLIPVHVTVKGVASGDMDLVCGDSHREEFKSVLTIMTDIATRKRQEQHPNQSVPRQTFVLRVATGTERAAGSGNKSSRITPPHTDGIINDNGMMRVDRELVTLQSAAAAVGERDYWRAGGLFDQWLGDEQLMKIWADKIATEEVTEQDEELAADAFAVPAELAERVTKMRDYYYGQARTNYTAKHGDVASERETDMVYSALADAGLPETGEFLTEITGKLLGADAANRFSALDLVTLTLMLRAPKQTGEVINALFGDRKVTA